MERRKMHAQLKKKRSKLGQQIDRYWKIRDVQRAIKIAGLLTDPKSTLKDAKKLLNEI
jgi:LPS O-antigen subunit length determinant protein (WzzB/FepE family)